MVIPFGQGARAVGLQLGGAALEHRLQLGQTRARRAQQSAVEIRSLETRRPIQNRTTIGLFRFTSCAECHVATDPLELDPRLPESVDALGRMNGSGVAAALGIADHFRVRVHEVIHGPRPCIRSAVTGP